MNLNPNPLACFLVLASLLFIQSCKKSNEPETVEIKAGAVVSGMEPVEPPSPLRLVAKQECPDSEPDNCTWVTTSMSLDLNLDGSTDIIFYSQRYANAIAAGPTLKVYPLNGFSFCNKPLQAGATIDDKLSWIETSVASPMLGTPDDNTLAYSFTRWVDGKREQNEWLEPAFFAVRYKAGRRTTYGWVKLKIEDFNKLSVYSWGCQK